MHTLGLRPGRLKPYAEHRLKVGLDEILHLRLDLSETSKDEGRTMTGAGSNFSARTRSSSSSSLVAEWYAGHTGLTIHSKTPQN